MDLNYTIEVDNSTCSCGLQVNDNNSYDNKVNNTVGDVGMPYVIEHRNPGEKKIK